MSKKPSQCSFPIRQISEEHTTYCSIHFKVCSMEISYLMSAMLIINIYKIPLELSKVHKLWRMVNFFLSLLHQLLSISKESYTLLAVMLWTMQYSYISNLTKQNFISLTLLTAFFTYKKEVFWFEDKKEKNYVEQKSWTDAFYITAILFNDKERWCYLHRYPPLYTYLPR